MRTRLVVTEALRSITANVSTTVAATLTVLIGMFLLGLFIALGTWVVSWTDNVKRELIVNVFFAQDATEAQINDVQDRLKTIPQVKEIDFVSEDEALEVMQAKFPDLTENLATNPLPASYKVTPNSADDLESIAQQLKPLPGGVDQVNYGKQKADRIRDVAGVIEIVFLVAASILIVASMMLIANTIRLSIFSRRREIEVMKLVGASNWFVRGPFMLEGLLCGFLGAIAAVVLLFLAREIVLPRLLPDVGSSDNVQAWGFEAIALILIGVGLLLGAAGSGITIRRFLRV